MLHSPLVPVPASLKQASALGLLRLASEVEPHIANRLKHLGLWRFIHTEVCM